MSVFPNSGHIACKPLIGLFHERAGTKFWRNTLDVCARGKTWNEIGARESLMNVIEKMDDRFPGLLDQPLGIAVDYRGLPLNAEENNAVDEVAELNNSLTTVGSECAE